MPKVQFYSRVKGPMDNYEDWYYLEKLETGEYQVTHSWSHVTPKLKSNSGSKTYSVTEFMGSPDVHTGAKTELDKRLKAEG